VPACLGFGGPASRVAVQRVEADSLLQDGGGGTAAAARARARERWRAALEISAQHSTADEAGDAAGSDDGVGRWRLRCSRVGELDALCLRFTEASVAYLQEVGLTVCAAEAIWRGNRSLPGLGRAPMGVYAPPPPNTHTQSVRH
jgi:hypothetical protein